jgi:hypothetical protein
MSAPFDRYLASLRPGDSESEKLRKLLATYGLRKEGGHFVTVRKDRGDDLTVDDLTDEDIDEINEDIGERDEGEDERDDGNGHSGAWVPTDTRRARMAAVRRRGTSVTSPTSSLRVPA